MDSLVPFSQLASAAADGMRSAHGTEDLTTQERWHSLLTTRYVCEICLTRFFVPHDCCPACHRFGYIRPLVSMLMTIARDDEELRAMIAQGQSVLGGIRREETSEPAI
jgi:hypothetical protein